MVKRQLRVYYGLRGLIGKPLDHAVKRDMRSLASHNDGSLRGYWRRNTYGIGGCLLFDQSSEGRGYWLERNIKL